MTGFSRPGVRLGAGRLTPASTHTIFPLCGGMVVVETERPPRPPTRISTVVVHGVAPHSAGSIPASSTYAPGRFAHMRWRCADLRGYSLSTSGGCVSSSLDSRIALARLELTIAQRDGPPLEALRSLSALNQLVAEAFNERCT